MSSVSTPVHVQQLNELYTALKARGGANRHRGVFARHIRGQALRALGNKLTGQLDGCLRDHQLYDEDDAW